MKVLVTGGAGYIGSALIGELVENASISEIVVYDNLSRGHLGLFVGENKLEEAKVRFVYGDILDGRKLKKALEGVEVVFHLAANVTTPYADQNPQQFEQINHWGTAELSRAIDQSAVKKLIYLSSTSVYGWSDEEVFADTSPQPSTYYGVSKLRGEEQVLCVKRDVEKYIIRCGNVFGYSPSMRKDTVVNSFMFNAHFSNRIKVMGTGEQRRAFISIQSVIEELNSFANQSNGVSPGVYNLVDHVISIQELSQFVKEVYPELEISFVNQHLTMRQVIVSRSVELSHSKMASFTNELHNFSSNFTF